MRGVGGERGGLVFAKATTGSRADTDTASTTNTIILFFK